MQNKRGKNWYRTRFAVLQRDHYQCQYCGQHAPNVQLEVDHKIELADGGTNSMDNLITSCWACNHGKASLWEVKHHEDLNQQQGKSTIKARIVEALTEHGPMSRREIANRIGASPVSVKALLNRYSDLFTRDFQGGGILGPQPTIWALKQNTRGGGL